jgi:energy-coupling factor transporter ATP-binding protein EcfA2
MTAPRAASNPFSTRFVRPGAVPFLFPPGLGAPGLVRALAARGWRGAILGPHGSGKSTLLAALLPALREAGKEPLPVALHDGQRTLPAEAWRDLLRPTPPGSRIAIIDGYEQLGLWQRWRLRRLCRRRGHGLLATAPTPVGLPVLLRLGVTPETAGRIVERLLGGAPEAAPGPGPADLAARLQRQGGNFREVLFELYDEWERQRVIAVASKPPSQTTLQGQKLPPAVPGPARIVRS